MDRLSLNKTDVDINSSRRNAKAAQTADKSHAAARARDRER